MGRSHDIATSTHGDTRYVNATGDSMTGNLGVGGAANGSYAITSHSSGGQNLRFENDNEYAFFRLDDNGDLNIWAHGDDNINFMNGTGSGTTRMNIDGSGHVTTPSNPAFKASIQTITGRSTTNTQLKTPYDTAQLNVGNHYSTSNYRFTAPVAGNYFFSISQNKLGKLIIYFVKNGTNFSAGEFLQDTAGSWEHCTISCVIPLAATDYVEPNYKLNNNGGAQYAWNGGSVLWDSFSGFLIG